VAAVVGYEAGGRIGRALLTADLARLYRPTGLVSPLAAALAGGLPAAARRWCGTAALSIAANTSCGLNQWPHTGGSEMYFHPAFAARNAVTAVELAELGAYASENILEGEAGLFAAFRRQPAPNGIALFADGQPEILSVYNKPVPACNFAQTACQAALHVAGRLGDDLANARAILVRVPAAAMRYPGCDFAGPYQRALQAKMSIQFGVAAALQRKAIAEENYQRLADAGILRLISLTSLEEDEAFTQRFSGNPGRRRCASVSPMARWSWTGSTTWCRRATDEIRARFPRRGGSWWLGLRARSRSSPASMTSRQRPMPGAWRRCALRLAAAEGTEGRPPKRAGRSGA
jgi:2-methylcitrate dehydratase PrpD